MNAIFRTIGILLSCLSLSMLPPAFVAMYYQDSSPAPFWMAFVITLLVGLSLWRPRSGEHPELKTRDGFLVVAFFWVTLCLFAALPLYLSVTPHTSITDALFETVSGLTATGATIFTKIDLLPHAVLYYRQQMQLLGGIGIVVLAVAVLPMLGIGGMQLYRAEVAGPIKNQKLTPRITQTAKALWSVYAATIVLCALAYWAAGMTLFDAIGESFATVSTGGFSTHEASFAFYHSDLINEIAVVFMLLGSINFSLHFQFLKTKSLKTYWADRETHTYLLYLLAVILVIFFMLAVQHKNPLSIDLEDTVFTVVSLATTTGFGLVHFNTWPTFVPYLLLLVSVIGGCSGSTSGGIKMIRAILLKEQAKSELNRMIHPRAVQVVKYGNLRLSDDLMHAVWGFVVLFIFVYTFFFLALLATGLSFDTTFSALTACIANSGAGIGEVADSYEYINNGAKWILTLSMLAGRLEIFSLIILFMPSYWKR